MSEYNDKYSNGSWYTTYWEQMRDEDGSLIHPEIPETPKKESESSKKPYVFERKDGMIKIYNGHVGTYVWEKEDDTETA